MRSLSFGMHFLSRDSELKIIEVTFLLFSVIKRWI